MRTKKAIINSLVSFSSQSILLLFAFATRKAFIIYLGTSYLGFDGLFSNIISIMTIIDLGLTSAMYYSLYKPIANKNYVLINQLVTYFKKIYYTIGGVLLISAIVATPFLSFFVNDGIDNTAYLSCVFLLYAFNSFVNYFFIHNFALLFVNQEEYKTQALNLITKICFKSMQIFILSIYPSYIAYLLVEFAFNLLNHLVLAIYVKRKYKKFIVKDLGLPSICKKEIFANVKILGISKIAEMGIASTDAILISKFVSIQMMGLFSNYQLVLSSSYALMGRLIGGVVSSFGNLVSENNKEQIEEFIKKYMFMSFFISSIYLVVATNLIQPFIKLFFGSAFLIELPTIIFIVINYYILVMFGFMEYYFNVSGNFKLLLPIKIIQMIINLVVSICLVSEHGVLGILLGTFVSEIFLVVAQIIMLFKHKMILDKYYFINKIFRYMVVSFVGLLLSLIINKVYFEAYTFNNFIWRVIVSVASVLLINCICFYRSKEFNYFKELFNKIISSIGGR